MDTDNLDFLADFDDTALDTAGHNSAATRDREHVLDWHQERAVDGALWCRNVGVERIGQGHDRLLTELAGVAFEGELSRAFDDRGVVARKVILGKKLAHFHFDQLQQLCIINHVGLVQEHDDVRHAHLTRQQDVLACLWHWAVGCGHHQHCAVHLRSTRDHVLDIVGVAGAVHVCVVTVSRLVLNVCCVNRNTTCTLFGSGINLRVAFCFATKLLGQNSRDRCSQRRFAVVNVADCADVNVWFGAFEFTFCHDYPLT